MTKTTKSSQKMYWEAVIDGLPRTLEPALSVWLFNKGCWGTQEELDFSQPDLKYTPKIRPRSVIRVSAYFDVNLKESVEGHLVNWLKRWAPASRVEWTLQASQDWLKEWKKHFKPLKVAGLRIVPSWIAKGKTSPASIIIEPGMAFGTGIHATTRFALELLRKVFRKKSAGGGSVLDVGSGSGILAVAAERFGAGKVTAIDNDPESWRECRKTFRLNKTKRCSVTTKQLEHVKITHDVVVANIIDGVLMDLKNGLWRATKQGGCIVLSGILADGAPAFKRAFMTGKKGRVAAEISDGEWTALLIIK